MLLLLLLAEALRVLPHCLVVAVLEELLIIILALVLEVSKSGRRERLVASLVTTHGVAQRFFMMNYSLGSSILLHEHMLLLLLSLWKFNGAVRRICRS